MNASLTRQGILRSFERLVQGRNGRYVLPRQPYKALFSAHAPQQHPRANDLLGHSSTRIHASRVPISRRKRRLPPPQPPLIPVTAVHLAQTIDLFAILSSSLETRQKKLFGKNSVVLELPDQQSYVTVFRFGSVVAVNLSPPAVADLLVQLRPFAQDPVLTGLERREQFAIRLADTEDDVKPVTADFCTVPNLDLNGVAVISNIMAQTVALDSYNDTVDDLLARFGRINAAVAKSGQLTSADKEFLFRSVAQNNLILIDMISKIRLKDRSDTAWNLTRYESIHYGLKEEFEIDGRFENVEFKLNLIQQNAKFFIEVLQTQKSNSLEWIIVVLILTECVLMCIEMAGLGEPIFLKLREILPSLPQWS